MEGVVVQDVQFVQRGAEVDNLYNDSIGNHQSFCWEEFGPFFEFIYLKFPPKFFIFVNSLIGEVS